MVLTSILVNVQLVSLDQDVRSTLMSANHTLVNMEELASTRLDPTAVTAHRATLVATASTP